jgi:hypothetical protein
MQSRQEVAHRNDVTGLVADDNGHLYVLVCDLASTLTELPFFQGHVEVIAHIPCTNQGSQGQEVMECVGVTRSPGNRGLGSQVSLRNSQV